MLEYRQKSFSNPSKLAVKKGNYKAFVYNANAKIRMPDQYVAMPIADYFMVILSILGVQKSYAIEKGYLFSTMLYLQVCQQPLPELIFFSFK